MSVEIELDRMTLPEKLELMETLWEHLTRRPDQLASPAWHKEVLEECTRKAESGEEKFVDWDAAKQDIRNRIA